MSNRSLDELVDQLADMAIKLGLNIEQIKECLDTATVEDDGKPFADQEGQKDSGVDYNADETKDEEVGGMINLNNLTLTEDDVDEFGNIINDNNNNVEEGNPFDMYFGKTAFGKKFMSKATESVRQIGKKKGIYIVGRKGKKFLGIRFTSKGNYSKNKKGRPNGKMYTLDGLRKMKKKRVSFKKLPQLIDMMDTGAVLKKHKDFKFGFELKKQPRGCSGFGYTFPVGAGYGRRSALLYSKL